MTRVRKSLIAASVSGLAIMAAGAAMAQTGPDVTEVDEVVVTGIRASLQQSLETKRSSNSIIDVVTAEDVGRFPSSNVAEAITIIPGVTIDREFGQGEKVSILGTDPALNRTLLNGQTVASADWFILDQPGRTFNYALLAPQIVGSVEVYKTPEPRIDEGSIGGTVIVNTRRPLDAGIDPISGAVTYLWNDRSEEGDFQYSVMGNWTNPERTFGVLVAAQRASDFLRRDGVQSYGTVTASDYLPSTQRRGSRALPPCVGACADTLAANPDAIGLNALAASYFEQQRDRDSYMAALQWRPTPNLEINFDWLRIDASYDNTNQSMFAFQGNTWNALDRLTDITVEDGIITRATFDNALSVLDVQYREAAMTSDSYRLNLEWTGDRWDVSAVAGYTTADGGTQRQLFGEFLNWSNYTVDISGAPGRPGVVTYEDNIMDDPTAFAFDGGWGAGDPTQGPTGWNSGWGGNIVAKPTTDEEQYAQIDLGYELMGAINRIQFGYKYRDHETDQRMSGVSIPIYGYVGDTSMFNPRQVPSNYLEGFDVNDQMRTRFVIDGAALADYLASGGYLQPWQTAPEVTVFGNAEFTSQNWNIQEAAHAAYVQADFDTGRMRGNFGLRYVRTESESGGYTCINQTASGCGTTEADWEWVVATKEYDNWLPSVNVAIDLADDLILRLSAAQVIARPNFADMSNYFWLSDQILTGGGGNPDLNPYESLNLHASLEWYFQPEAILGAEFFYKDIDNYILQQTSPEDHFNQAQQAVTTYQISRPANAGSAQVRGVALAYQQTFAYGFGLLANYTYVDAEADNGDPLPYNSNHQLNISPFYENGPFSARLGYSWRSEYFTGVDRANNMYVDDHENLDATVSWAFSDQVSMTFAGQNLLDSEYYNYADTVALPRGVYRTGRKLMATLAVNF
ncbi:LOW QUALITY PROTEIN: N-acetylglucosamine-regulated TonB-dependent outer membrane receptor [Brevundimonas abyssalis TAR-001]|uniref:N-acetylglucosamine-regulated TonB-dependent outer membrane receptor n=1 Tax=Brevundimonas abyssalis TAR-001 TaxID=1391729 RepID=A0A8E0KKH3_9CAUL|nr:LOW QUALITY PROTEIN: N-acetylglucosamine-regulated TonB-dependent outer membrane receptor [Brevundimonas abyssalis TAR-001]